MRVQLRILEDRFGASFSKRRRLILVATAALTSVLGVLGCDRFSDPDSSRRAESKDGPAADVSSEEHEFHSGELLDQHHRMMDSQTRDPDLHESDSSDERHQRGGMHGRDGQ